MSSFSERLSKEEILENVFKKVIQDKKPRKDGESYSVDDYERIILNAGELNRLDDVILLAKKKVSQAGLDEVERKSGVMFVNGMFARLDENYHNSMLEKIEKTLQFLQMQVYHSTLLQRISI